MNISNDIFIKKKKAVVINLNNHFVYEVFVHCLVKNNFCVANSEVYVCSSEIKNVVDKFKIDENITIVCELYSAPLSWLIENDYKLYVKPVKNPKNKLNKNEVSGI